MVVIKDTLEYTPIDPNFKPLPKYGHLSELDPLFVQFQPTIDESTEKIWTPSFTLDEFRALWKGETPGPPGCPTEGEDVVTETRTITVRDGAQIEVKVYSAKDKKPGSALMMRYHGGGFVVGGHGLEHPENVMIAAKTNTVVVSVDYRMAPDFRFPIPVNDCFDALKWAKENAASLGADPNKILINGGSAGGSLASVVVIMARDEGITGVVGQILSFPVTVHPKFAPKDKYEFGSYQQNRDASIITSLRLEWFLDQYMPEPTDDWRLSSLLAPSLKNLPPALVTACGCDPLRDDAMAYAERLQEEGGEVELVTFAGLPHALYLLPQHPKAQEYYDNIIAFTKKFSG